jgi:hypothetical protein
VAFLGDYSDNGLSDAQVNAAIHLVDHLNDRFADHSYYNRKDARPGPLAIYTHADLNKHKDSELKGAQAQIQTIKAETAKHFKEQR